MRSAVGVIKSVVITRGYANASGMHDNSIPNHTENLKRLDKDH